MNFLHDSMSTFLALNRDLLPLSSTALAVWPSRVGGDKS